MPVTNYQNFDILIDRGPLGYRARVIGSPAGEAVDEFALSLTREALVALSVKEFGSQLYRAAFCGDVSICLRRSLDEAERCGAGLRIRLRLGGDVPELADLPWEYLFAPDLNRFLVLSDLTPLVRYSELPQRVRPLRVTPPLTVLAVVSNPSNVPMPLAVEQEWERLRSALRELESRRLVRLERLATATLPALQARLRDGPIHIFHFLGHGFFDSTANAGGLIFENEYRQSEIVTAERLGMILHDHTALRLIFLNACEGAASGSTDSFAGVAQHLIQQGIPAVLAMQFPVSDAAALTLSSEFYRTLADGYPADAALSEARKAVAAQGNEREWGTPVLFSRSDDNHLFELTQENAQPIVETRSFEGKYQAQATFGPAQLTYVPGPSQERQTADIARSLLADHLNKLAAVVSTEIGKQLESARLVWRSGKRHEAIRWAKELKTDETRWSALEPAVKARLLCFEGSLELDAGNVEHAGKLADEAYTLSPTDAEARLRALIALRQSGPEAALEYLTEYDDLDSRNLKAALLLDNDQVRDSLSQLDLANLPAKPNADTFRVRSLAYFRTKNIGHAQLEIQRALELEPNSQIVQLAAAIINYYSALSPAVLPDRFDAWPEPVDWVFVKCDSESMQRLRQAARTFEEISKNSDVHSDERRRLQIWQLACQASDPEQGDDAAEHCRALIRELPTDYATIVWAMARKFSFDIGKSETELENLIAHETPTIPHILALASCYFLSGTPPKAVQLLEKDKPVFEARGAETVWVDWYTRALLTNADPESALKAIAAYKPSAELRHVQAMALMAQAENTGDWQPVATYFKQSYDITGAPAFLLGYCETLARQNQWAAIADLAADLINAVHTGEVLRLTMLATYRAGRFDICLKTLDEHRDWFAEGKLPLDLRRIRIGCQHALGMLPKAIVEAEELTREESEDQDLINLASLWASMGDLKRLAIVARRFVNRESIPPDQLLQVARLIEQEDPALSVLLFKQALRNGLPDSVVSLALPSGFQLGLDASEELKGLMSRVAELGKRGEAGVFMVGASELLSFAARQHEEITQLGNTYQAGMLPIHLLSDRLNRSLAIDYHLVLLENAKTPDPARQYALLARHGGRSLLHGFLGFPPGCRLNLDVTAVLLAEHLGILSMAEIAFAPLRMPAHLIPALIQMRAEVLSPQPSQLQNQRQVMELVKRGVLKVVEAHWVPGEISEQLVQERGEEWSALLEVAIKRQAYVVDFLPLRKRDLSGVIAVSPEVSARLVNPRAIADALWQRGCITQDEFDQIHERLGTEGQVQAYGTVPLVGSLLYCEGTISEFLASVGLLPITCEHFQVHVSKRQLDRIERSLDAYVRAQELAAWTDRLRERISRGIERGVYEIIPSPLDLDDILEESSIASPNERCILSLLKCDIQNGDIFWIDDRYLNAYLRRDSAPIIGINEVLKALVTRGSMSADDYYAKLIDLRAANVRFIPVQSDEILYHLRQTKSEHGIVSETRGLRILRRYVAASLLQSTTLQRPPLPENAPNANGEVAFVTQLSHAVTGALAEVWKEFADNEDACYARSEWLISNLHLELGSLRRMLWLDAEQNDLYPLAAGLADLLSLELTFLSRDDRIAIGSRYQHWLLNRVVRQRLAANPSLAVSVADALKSILVTVGENVINDLPKDEHRGLVTALLHQLFDNLPQQIREEMKRDADFTARMDLAFVKAMNLGELIFDSEEFIRAATQAINGQPAKLTTLDSDIEVIFHPRTDDLLLGQFYYMVPSTGQRQLVADDRLALLSDSVTVRQEALTKNRRWFDCKYEDSERLIAEIASGDDPRRRIDETQRWMDASAAVYYADLQKKLHSRQSCELSDLLPTSAAGLLRHYRLAPDTHSESGLREALNEAAQDIIACDGIAVAIERLSGLPVPLPEVVVATVAELSAEQRRGLFKRLLKTISSPVGKIHLVRLLLDSKGDSRSFRRLAKWIIRGLFSPEGKEVFGAFRVLLEWVSTEFNYRSDMSDWPAHIKLAMVWSHAHRLLSLFLAGDVQASWLQKLFSDASTHKIPVDIFHRDSKYWLDVVHPRRVDHLSFTLKGLSYCLQSKAEACLDQELKNLLVEEAFPETDGVRMPALALLRNSVQAQNGVSSFLGKDTGEVLSVLIDPQLASAFGHSWSEGVLGQLASGLTRTDINTATTWMLFANLTQDLPLSADLAAQVKPTICGTDFIKQFGANLGISGMALHAASLLQMQMQDQEVYSHLKKQIMELASVMVSQGANERTEHSASLEPPDSASNALASLLDSITNVAVSNPRCQDPVIEFADLLTQLLETLPAFTAMLRPIIQRLYEELPISQSGRFARLLVRCRAS